MTDALAGRVLAGRYEVQKVLGQGAMGQVWRARQIQLDRDVAIKVLRTAGPVDARARRRLHREARLVARISHPHVVQVYDYGETDDGAPFLVMEYIDGVDAVLPMSQCGSLPAILSCTDAILSALEAAHGRGVLHRDLKPANMVLRGGDPARVVLLDFGIAAILGGDHPAASFETASGLNSQLTREGTVVGTPLYMSPEQAQGMPATEASDLYAVGVMLYEWLCGQPPFVGGAEDVMRSHAFRLPPPLTPKASVVVPEALAAVVTKALAKRPEARFGSAGEMREAIQRATEGPAAGVPSPEAAPDLGRNDSTLELSSPSASRVGLARLADAPFVGRLRERHALHDRIQAGLLDGGVVVVEGEEGVGKTRLVEEVLRDSTLPCALGRAGLQPGGGSSLALLRRAVEDLLGLRNLTRAALGGRLSALLATGGASGPFGLAEAERERLTEWLRPDGGRSSREDPASTSREVELVERALRAHAARQPIVLLLDDLQWADAATFTALSELASSLRLRPAKLVLVLCRRPAEGEDPLVGLLRYEGELVHRLPLGRLSRADTEQLLRAQSPLSPSTATELAARADGSPLFAVQLLRTLQQRDQLVEGRDGLESRASDDGLPDSLAQILAQRLDRAGAEADGVLHAAAVLGHAFDVAVLEDVLAAVGGEASADALDDAIDQLVEARVLVEPPGGGDRLAWEHPLLRQLVLERTRKSRRRRRLCRAAADALAGPDGPARPVVELYLLAGDRAAAAPHAARAGDEAVAGGELDEARRLFELAIELGPPPSRSAALWGLGTAENHLGHVERAERAFRGMLDADPPEAAWAWFGVGRCQYIRGAHAEAVDSLDRALALARESMEIELQCRILRTLAGAAAELPDRPVPELGQLPEVLEPRQRLELLKTAGFVALRRGDPEEAVVTLEQALEQARALGADPSLADLLCDLGHACRSAGDPGAAREHLREALRLSRGPGQHRTEAEVLNELGELARASGDGESAARHYADAVQIWAALDSRLVVVGMLNQALVAVDLGRFDEARKLVTDLHRRPGGVPAHLHAPFLLTTALAAVGVGDPKAAGVAFRHALQGLEAVAPLDEETSAVLRQLAALAQGAGAPDLALEVAAAIRRLGPGVSTSA